MEEKAEKPTEKNGTYRSETMAVPHLRCYGMAQKQKEAYPIKETQRR